MKIKLYQVNPEKDTKQVMFMPYGMMVVFLSATPRTKAENF